MSNDAIDPVCGAPAAIPDPAREEERPSQPSPILAPETSTGEPEVIEQGALSPLDQLLDDPKFVARFQSLRTSEYRQMTRRELVYVIERLHARIQALLSPSASPETPTPHTKELK